jgi:hypothetical protein
MLVCHQCHRKIDQKDDGGRYTASLLKNWKQAHERRVEIVTGISSDLQSHVLFYGANIGEQNSPLKFSEAGNAMFPQSYPATDQAIELGVLNSASKDRDQEYWSGESRQLASTFERRVRERIAAREVSHLSVFALAPQPLLVLLGTQLGDIVPVTMYQRHREPPSWGWPSTAEPLAFNITEPADTSGTPALVLGVSATVTSDRIKSVLGDNASIWTVSVPTPHNDIIKSSSHLSQFGICSNSRCRQTWQIAQLRLQTGSIRSIESSRSIGTPAIRVASPRGSRCVPQWGGSGLSPRGGFVPPSRMFRHTNGRQLSSRVSSC